MKNYLFLSLALLFVCLQGKSQDSTSAELGLNINPVLGLLSGNFGENWYFNLRYKKGDDLKFRAILGSRLNDGDGMTYDSIVAVNDSVVVLQYYQEDFAYDYDLRLGVEKQFIKERWGWYFGVDAIVGYQVRQFHYIDEVNGYTHDEDGNLINLPNYTDSGYIDRFQNFDRTKRHYWYAGLGGSVGLIFNMADHWQLSAELPFKWYLPIAGKEETQLDLIQPDGTFAPSETHVVDYTPDGSQFDVYYLNLILSFQF